MRKSISLVGLGLFLVLLFSQNGSFLVFPAYGLEAETPNISLEFKDAQVVDILKIIAERAGLNIVVSGNIGLKMISVHFADLGYDQALQQTADQAGMTQIKLFGGKIRVFGDARRLTSSSKVSPPLFPESAAPISMDFRQADIRDLAKIVSTRCGGNILLNKSIRGNLGCRFSNTPWNEALAALALATEADLELCGSTVVMADRKHLEEMRLSTIPSSDANSQKRSISIHDTDLRDVFGLAARSFGRDFIAGPTVRGNVTVQLINLPEDELITLLARTNGFEAERFGSLWVLDDPLRLAENHKKLTLAARESADSRIHVDFRDATLTEIFTLVSSRTLPKVQVNVQTDQHLTLKSTKMDGESVLKLVAIMAHLVWREENGTLIFSSQPNEKDPK